jgi:hypothetical protein
MNDPAIIAAASATLAAISLLSGAALRGWKGWLELKRAELENGRTGSPGSERPVGKVDVADLKQRVRRLEAIASGIEI